MTEKSLPGEVLSLSAFPLLVQETFVLYPELTISFRMLTALPLHVWRRRRDCHAGIRGKNDVESGCFVRSCAQLCVFEILEDFKDEAEQVET